jgi:hypothetical protein
LNAVLQRAQRYDVLQIRAVDVTRVESWSETKKYWVGAGVFWRSY